MQKPCQAGRPRHAHCIRFLAQYLPIHSSFTWFTARSCPLIDVNRDRSAEWLLIPESVDPSAVTIRLLPYIPTYIMCISS